MKPFPIDPAQFVWLWLAVAVATFGGAALLRGAQGLPFFLPKFPDAEIQQTWRSGAASAGLLGRLARANNCLWFVLTRDTLHVGMHFPFNMFLPPFIARLDLTIPVGTISSVSEDKAILGGDFVRVTYAVPNATGGVARMEHVDLWPASGDHFVDVLREKARAAKGVSQG
jgi:hypothetical protein